MCRLRTVKERGIILNGLVLALLRQRAEDMSVKAAAAAVGVSAPLWSMWESGKRGVTDENLAAIGALFDLDDVRVLRADVLNEILGEADRHRARRNSLAAAS